LKLFFVEPQSQTVEESTNPIEGAKTENLPQETTINDDTTSTTPAEGTISLYLLLLFLRNC